MKIVPGGPQTNGALMLLYRKFDFFMGGDKIGNYICAQSELPLIAVAADFQKSPQILMSHPDVGLDQWADLPKARPVYAGAGAVQSFYAWLRLAYGFGDDNIPPTITMAAFIQNKGRSSRATSPPSP